MTSDSRKAGHAKRIPIAKWLWGSYLRAALIPLLVVELTFLGLYWASNQFSYERKIDVVSDLSAKELNNMAASQANVIARQLEGLAKLTKIYAEQTALALGQPGTAGDEEKARYAYSPEGVFHTTRDNGGSAAFYSGIVEVGAAEREKVWRTARLDPLMKSIKDASPLIAQIYLNTPDSYNRIYPYFDVLATYPPKMDIPSYNFYYEADAQHDPGRHAVWTDAYVDPAGSGWMVSSIAPAYDGDRLEAVVGIDVTVAAIVHQVLDISLPWNGYALLIGRDGTILAMPAQGERDLGLKELTNYSYQEAIKQDTFKPDVYNIFKRPDTRELGLALSSHSHGVLPFNLKEKMVGAWSDIAGVGWKLLVLAPEHAIMADAEQLHEQLGSVAWLMTGGLFLFYLLFVAFLWRRANVMGERLSAPLRTIVDQFSRLTAGNDSPSEPNFEIAELQSVGEHLIVASNRIKAANQSKSTFLANMSHEIRTPMNGVVGLLDVLSHSRLAKDDRKMVDSIRQSALSLLTILDDILDFSKIEAGKLAIAEEPMRLEEEFDAVSGLLDRVASEKGVEFTVFFDPVIPSGLIGDALRLRQILTNLAGNAVKFSSGLDRLGRVHLRAELDGHEKDRVWVRFSVEDNGIGIDGATLDRLFQPFEQGDGGTTRTYGGTGLGLVISQNLARMMGGAITVESRVDLGSTFTARLPFPLGAEGAADPTEADLTGLEAVVVGDEPRFVADYSRYLAHAGAQVHSAEEMEQAWELIKDRSLIEPVCLLVMGKPSLEAAQEVVDRLLAGEPERDVRVIVPLSYLSIEKGRRREARRIGDKVVEIDREALSRRNLLNAVALAAGRTETEASDRKEADDETFKAPPSRDQAVAEGRLILVAEDNETNLEVIQLQLNLLGFAVDLARDGCEAYAKWQTGEYGLLLTDLHMPNKDGYDLTASIRREEQARGGGRLPIVALTANALKGEKDRCLSTGMDDYISKPVELDRLREVIETWLPAPEPARGGDADTEEPPEEDGDPGIDPAMLGRMVGDDPDLQAELIGDFLKATEGLLADLDGLHAEQDVAAYGNLSHRLKSSVRSFGANRLGDLFADLERAGKADDWATIDARHAEVGPAFREVKAFYERRA